MRRIAGIVALVVLFAGMVLGGCAKKRVVGIDNLPPETTLFVQGALDTVNHVVRLYWFGSDPDGEVSGFELRFEDPARPADTAWVFTARTDSTFTIPTPTGYARPVFSVRAIDDRGLRDPTPASADFQFSNQPPTVRFTQRLRTTDTTYASVTLAWTASDPDGDATRLRFQVGLDTVPAALTLLSGNGVTLDTTAFKEGGAYPPTRPRMAFIRAIDDGGRLSPWDSVRWVVRAPSTGGMHPRLLLIDDVPANQSSAHDVLYWGTASRNLPAGSYSILRMEYTQPFRSNKDVTQTFRQFDAVVWYRGTQETPSTVMRSYQDGMAAYLDGGGRLLIESLNLIEGRRANGALREEWVTRYLGSSDLIYAPIAGEADTSVSWSIQPGYVDTIGGVPITRRADLRSTVFADSLRNNINANGLRGFAVRDTGHVAIWARDSTLSPRVPRSIPVAVTVPVPASPAGPGRVIVTTVPIAGANGFGTSVRFLCKLFNQMGLGVCP